MWTIQLPVSVWVSLLEDQSLGVFKIVSGLLVLHTTAGFLPIERDLHSYATLARPAAEP